MGIFSFVLSVFNTTLSLMCLLFRSLCYLHNNTCTEQIISYRLFSPRVLPLLFLFLISSFLLFIDYIFERVFHANIRILLCPKDKIHREYCLKYRAIFVFASRTCLKYRALKDYKQREAQKKRAPSAGEATLK